MKRSILVCLAFLVIADSALAQVHPVLERGFAPDKIYQVGDVDSVNPFNGNLIISLPLGPTYPVGGDLNYQMTLTYNSMLWDYLMVADDTHPLCERGSGEAPPPGEYCENLWAEPTPLANAGLGWRLSLGDLLAKGQPGNTVPTWLYIAPDGSQHALVETLHESDSADTDVWYTRDNSYMRMKVLAYGGAGNPIKMSVEAANGITRVFTRSGLVWRLKKIKDSFGNYLKIVYFSTYWELRDSVGRVHKIYWATVAGKDVVNKLELTAFDSPTPAAYQFVYSNAPIGTSIEQSCKDSHFGNLMTITVPLLTEVQLPDGSAYKMKESVGDPPDPAYYDTNFKLPGHTCTIPRSGILKRLVLPTGGFHEWQFERAEFPTGSGIGGCVEEGDELRQVGLGVTAGVGERKIISAVDQSATWTYDYPPVSDQTADSIIRTITSPDNDDTVHYFRTQGCQYDETKNGHIAWTGWDYGLPFDPGITRDGRYRSVAFYDGTGGSRALKRARYVLYEHDQLPPLIIGWPRTWYDSNRRVAEAATYYVDDGWRKAEQESSTFDGLGHYRTKTLDGFSSGARTGMTNFNPTRGTYSINPTTNTYTGDFLMLALTEAWILNTYDYTKQTEGTITAKQEHCFDTSTGKLERTRTLTFGTSRNSHDLLAIFGYGGAGNLIDESYYGGDSEEQELNIVDPLCTLIPPSYEYRLNHSYLYGVRRKTTYSSITLNLLDTDIDMNTGLVKRSRDVSGFGTNWTYDTSGRVTAITPDAGARVTVAYTGATGVVTDDGFTPAKIDVRFRPHSTSATIARENFEFDGLGRLTVEKRLLPDQTWAEKLTRYTLTGWPSQISEWVVEGGTHRWTTYSGYDPFGRSGKITRPDGKSTTLAYTGGRVVASTVGIGTGIGSETNFTTTAYRDHLGRVTKVVEPLSATSTYNYDVGSRVSKVAATTSSGTQNRIFNYDNRGFLNGEKMPEKGASGNGTVTYSDYDSRGHATRVVDGPHELVYNFDAAERLTRIAKNVWNEEEQEYEETTLETRTYAASNSGSDLRKGKLTRAIRHNFYDGTQDFKVDESYVYKGLGGRVSQRTTIAGVSGGVFTQGFSWDELGVLKTEDFPFLSGGGSLPRTGPNRMVSYWYTKGFLTAVPGFANEISYHANGMANQTVHSNGVTDTRTLDSYGMARPRNISTSGADSNWSSGIFAYDGAGNITKTGDEWYLYDGLGRLKEGTAKNSAGSPKTQKYTYDGFGNQTSIWTTDVGTRTINVNHLTNRLTGSSYDAAGNQTSWGSGSLTYTYAYYPFNQIRTISGGSPNVDRWYAYTADGERIASYASDSGETTFAIRDLEGHVLREYLEKNGAWSWKKDYVWGADGLLSTISPDEGTRHFTLDHLGTPRLVCDRCADRTSQHNYFPFGEEATDAYQDTAKMKFTGHERDLNRDGQTTDDLDYMHARYYNLNLGRFLSVDPVGGSVGSSQSWNRYSYVLNNPLNLIDPTGLNADTTCDANNNCVVQVRADIVRDPNDPDQVAAANAFQQGGEDYWNNLTATGNNGETITFDVQFIQVDPGNANPGTDTLTVVSGSGASVVAMRMAPAGQTNPPDRGQIFTQDTTNNPSGMAGIAAHETGHLMGLRDLYVPGQAVPYVPGSQGEIMRHAQPGNQAGTAWQVLVPSQNFNVTLIRASMPTPIP